MKMFFTAACLGVCFTSSVVWAKDSVQPSPEAILAKADDVRNPSESFFMKVTVTDDDTASLFEVYTGGKTRTLIKTVKPERDKGRDMLMLGDDMWAYVPNLKRAVRISLSQKLTGQAANGDISRMRWHGDYSATIEKETDKMWVLFLTAKRKGLTYDKIRATVEKSTFRPLGAEYLTTSGASLKRATFGAFKKIAGDIRPTEIVIVDAKNNKDKSVITIINLETKEFPASFFKKETLGKK